MREIVVFRTGQLGDTLVALPALYALRAKFPDARITAIVDNHAARGFVSAREVLEVAGCVDSVAEYNANARGGGVLAAASLWRAIRRNRAEMALLLTHSNRPRASRIRDRLFFRFAGIKDVIGPECGRVESLASAARPLVPREPEFRVLLRRVPGVGDDAIDDAIANSTSSWRRALTKYKDPQLTEKLRQMAKSRTFLAVATGAKHEAKLWKQERWVKLLRSLCAECGVFPVLLGTNEEQDYVQKIVDQCGSGVNLCGALGIAAAGALLAECSGYVGLDTGVMHLAASVGVRCVGLFSARDWPQMWVPMGGGHTCLRHSVACEGCMLAFCPRNNQCMDLITVEEVLTACRAQLRSRE